MQVFIMWKWTTWEVEKNMITQVACVVRDKQAGHWHHRWSVDWFCFVTSSLFICTTSHGDSSRSLVSPKFKCFFLRSLKSVLIPKQVFHSCIVLKFLESHSPSAHQCFTFLFTTCSIEPVFTLQPIWAGPWSPECHISYLATSCLGFKFHLALTEWAACGCHFCWFLLSSGTFDYPSQIHILQGALSTWVGWLPCS